MSPYRRPIVYRLSSTCATITAVLLATSVAHEVAVPLPKLLQKSVPVESLSSSGDGEEPLIFQLTVPEGARRLVFQSAGGAGDCDLYVRFGAHPSMGKSDRQSLGARNLETITITDPAPGPWFVLVKPEDSFSGVRLTARYQQPLSGTSIPRFSPGPGTFAGAARVRLLSPVQGAVIRYTTDGSEPTANSLRYKEPLNLVSDTALRVRSFLRNNAGPVVDALYFVEPEAAPTPLVNGLPLRHRAGMAGRVALFKIVVPAGQARLRVTTNGGSGNSDVRTQHGFPPTTSTGVQRANGARNNATINITDPAPGDWFIELRALANFTGCTIKASYRAALPDLIAWAPAVVPYVTEETFTAEDCEVQEGMIAAGTHTLLRFATESRNIGGSDLVLGDPEGNPNFEFQECHGHHHFKGFARYRLLDAEGNTAAVGQKVSFCLLDVVQWDPEAVSRAKYSCDKQGIQAGWSDVYSSGLPGQWIDITGVAPGSYVLEITINPDALLAEGDYSNNTTRVPVVID